MKLSSYGPPTDTGVTLQASVAKSATTKNSQIDTSGKKQ